jgi:hypothetical protein
MSICCPNNMYINGSFGCIYCSGKIFGTDDYQVCCNRDEIYDILLKRCKKCKGIIDNTGTICCSPTQYVSYNSDATTSCV